MIKVDDISKQIKVQVLKSGWMKRTYQFVDNEKHIGQLYFAKSYIKKATANIRDQEFIIKRGGFWKHYIKISSDTQPNYNMRIDVNWRHGIKVVDADRNPYEFKRISIWRSKWVWMDRHARSVIEITSKALSKKNRGIIEIKYDEMKDPLFWIMVAWFLIFCSESDEASLVV